MRFLTTYKADFEYQGFNVKVKATFYKGRCQTYYEPEEPAGFEPITIIADDTEVDDVEEFFGVEDFNDFWIIAEEHLFSTNEYLIYGIDPEEY